MPSIQHKRGSRTALAALATAKTLSEGQIYLISEESRIAIATSTGTFETFAKQSEGTSIVNTDGGGVTGTPFGNIDGGGPT